MTFDLVTPIGKGWVALMQRANSFVDGYLGISILLSLFFVVFILTKRFQSKRGVMAGSFLIMILAVIFRLMEILSDKGLFVSFAMFLGSLIWIYFDDN